MMGYMRPTFAQGRKASTSKLLELRRQAQKDKEPRVVLRIQGILMSLAGHTTGEIADHLKVHRSTIPLWIDQWCQCRNKTPAFLPVLTTAPAASGGRLA